MEYERSEERATICEGYQVLLRAEARLMLPKEKPKIRAFYEKLSGACMSWATEVYGEGLRREFCALEEIRERAAFRLQRYRFGMRIAHEDAYYTAIVCESELTDQWREPQKSYHRTAQVWDTREETILPLSQTLARFGMHLSRGILPFRPDGAYPEGEYVVCFRNVTECAPFLEKRLPRSSQAEKKEKKEKNE